MTTKKTVTSHKKKRRTRKSSYRADFEAIVGKEMYGCWIDMLQHLVPGGRTHRLCVLVAGMLQYTWDHCDHDMPGNKVFEALEEATNDPDPGGEALSVIESLFKEAGVKQENE
ncbi:MAG: hypothetical protein HYW48_12595 [Deltaproteobacteria bacterium]|nr:hypothetical protein [Deltaproteobacteria bacterium]